uniref:Nudix hydrolase domain-containing protein n=1 Tax=Meloidogyne enterolobii TaxID=390850 RepID=A0A6V7Y5U5_MELEN|nr:unnamed protein product [Meloidogyne enterolobii]
MEMRQKVEEYDNLDIFHKILVQKRNQEFLYSISKDKRNFPFKIENFEMERRNERSCYKFDKVRGCKIDLSELYVKYKATEVFGLNLARSYLPSSYWIKPDLEDVNLYKDLWHSDNKLDLLPDHEKGNDKHRVINRCSFYGKYPVHNGYPLNPVARTGFKGRGSFGQWGPTNGVGAILYVTDKEDFDKFEFLGVENGKYEKRSYIVTPGGFVDMGEEFEYSAKRELIEEAFGLKKKRNKEEFEKMEEIIGKGELVKFGGAELSQLSTDNAWTESITFAFGVDSTIKKELKLKKGSDAQQVMWIQIEPADKEIDVKTELEKLFDLEERIDYILENFEACWTPPKEEETSHKEHKAPKEEDRTGKDTQDNTQTIDEKEDKICYKLNSDKMQFMQNVAYLYLIKKYNEKTFLEILANKKVKNVEQGQIFNEKEKKEDLKEKEESLNEEKAGEDDENKYNPRKNLKFY